MYVYIYIYIGLARDALVYGGRGGWLRGARFVSVTNGCEIVTYKRICREVS